MEFNPLDSLVDMNTITNLNVRVKWVSRETKIISLLFQYYTNPNLVILTYCRGSFSQSKALMKSKSVLPHILPSLYLGWIRQY